MELSLERRPITVNETILDINTEQAVESDVLLADYYPRISRILHCSVDTSAEQAVVSGERLIIDGMAVCRILYKSEEGAPAAVTVKLSYSKTVELRRAPQKPQVYVKAQPGYFSCRAVNSGRIDIRGAVVLSCKVISTTETEAVGSAQGGGVQCRCRDICCGRLLRYTTKSFLVRGEETLSSDIPATATLLRSSATVGETSFKVVGGKIVAKSDAEVKLLLIDGDRTLYRDSFQLPVSEILDAEGADEDSICSVAFTVDWVDVKLSSAAADEQPTASAELCITARIWAMNNETGSFMVDCFSTGYETTRESRPFSISQGADPVHRTVPVEQELTLPDSTEEVLDLWTELAEETVTGGDHVLKICGRVRFCALVQMEGGEPEYVEQTADFCEDVPVEGPLAEILPALSARLEEQKNQGSGILARAAVQADVAFSLGDKAQLITEVTVDENRPVKPKNAGCLTLYFPERGEQVWDIAKRYSTSPSLILQENGLQDDGAVGEGMLLIPAIR